MVTLDYAIDTVMQLPIEQRNILINIIRRRAHENRRREIAQDARQAMVAFRQGKLKPQPAQEIITELRQFLQEAVQE